MDQQELEKKGYSIFNFPDIKRLDELNHVLSDLMRQKQNPHAEDQGFYFASFDNASTLRQQVHNIVSAEMQPFIQQYFPEYKPLVANIILKEPGDKEVPLHQDWSFVDENLYSSYAIWLPLEETTRENGGLYVLEGSHHWFNNYRSTRVNTQAISVFPHVKQHLKFMEIKKGQGVIFNHKLLHYTPPNLTSKNRMVVQTAIIPTLLQPFFPYRESDQEDIIVYQVNDPFFINEDIWEKPAKYPVFKVIPYKDNDEINIRTIKRKLRKQNLVKFFLNEKLRTSKSPL
jgi:hypothetical protein